MPRTRRSGMWAWLAGAALVAFVYQGTAQAQVVWWAGTESGDLREWYQPCPSAQPCGNEGGGEFNSGGSADSQATTERRRSGSWAIKQTLTSFSESGTRLFRWAEPGRYSALYYSFWSYLPQGFAPANGYGWWMHSGFKVRRTQGGPVNNMLHLFLDYTYDPNQMYLYLDYFPPQGGNKVRYTQRLKAMPVGRWFQTEAYLRRSRYADGQLIVWLDGTQIFNIRNIVTRGSGTDGTPHWEATTNYGYNLSPASVTKYVDDVQISTTR
jgi:hypothetical protein